MSETWSLNEPLDSFAVRRGDALGFLPIANEFSNWLAPGLTNRTTDARWLSLLCWSLQRSQMVWAASGGGQPKTAQEARQRYAWLRPLELLWVARAVEQLEGDSKWRQLPGVRSVKRWIDDRDAQRFAMQPRTFEGYRQAGAYGAYRVTLRKADGLTVGDGWTPAVVGTQLARDVDRRLGRAARPAQKLDVRPSIKKTHWLDQEDRYWLSNWSGWPESSRHDLLPSRLVGPPSRLPAEERLLLCRALFGIDPAGRRRRRVALAIQRFGGGDHLSLCRSIARHFAGENPVLSSLPAFSALADAAIDALEAIEGALVEEPAVSIREVASDPRVRDALSVLPSVTHAWQKRQRTVELKHEERVNTLATALDRATTIANRCEALVRFHDTNGGGIRWVRLQGGRIERSAGTQRQGGGARYRFALRSLARIARQVGVAQCPSLFVSTTEAFAAQEDADEA